MDFIDFVQGSYIIPRYIKVLYIYIFMLQNIKTYKLILNDS